MQSVSPKEILSGLPRQSKVVMMNLLKFKPKADSTNLEASKPPEYITEKEAYQLYMDYTIPELEKVGSWIIFCGNSKSFLIGPEFENWDVVLLVEHQSVARFMEFAQNKDYLKRAGHRAAALEGSRLLPMTENDAYTPR